MEYIPNGLGFLCPYCGAQNPHKGRCGNCEEEISKLPKGYLLTKEQLEVFRAVVAPRKHKQRGSL